MATVGLRAMSQCICFKMTSTVDKFYEVERIVALREKVLLIHLCEHCFIYFSCGVKICMEYLVLWSDYPKEQASCHNEATFALPKYPYMYILFKFTLRSFVNPTPSTRVVLDCAIVYSSHHACWQFIIAAGTISD